MDVDLISKCPWKIISKYLLDVEVTSAERLANPKLRLRALLSRSVLRSLCSRYLQLAPAEIEFRYGPFGKPFLANSKLRFNLSHSQNVLLISFQIDSAIGCDIETLNDLNWSDLFHMEILSQDELLYLANISEKCLAQAFFRIWTRKEAVLKCLGLGLSVPLSTINTCPAESKPVWLGRVLISDLYDLPPSLAGAVAVWK